MSAERELERIAADLTAEEPPLGVGVADVVALGRQRRVARRRRRLFGGLAAVLLATGGGTAVALANQTSKPVFVVPTPPAPTSAPPTSAAPSPEKPGLTVSRDTLTPYRGPELVTGTYQQSNCVVSEPIRVAKGGKLSLTNCWIRVNVGDNGSGMLRGDGRIELRHTLIDGSAHPGETLPVLLSGGGSVQYSEFIGNTHNIWVRGGAADIRWNHIHQPKRHTTTGETHSFGVTVSAGGPVTVAHNVIDVTGAEGLSTVVSITSDFGPIAGVTITDNTLRPGGSYAMYVRTDGFCACGTVTDVRVTGNRFFADAEHRWGGLYGAFSVNDPASVTEWSGNTLTRAGGAVVPLPEDDPQP